MTYYCTTLVTTTLAVDDSREIRPVMRLTLVSLRWKDWLQLH